MEPDVPPIIEVRDVRKSFGGVEVLRGVSFDVAQGETLCLLGGSGGGKTTLLKVMIGALRADSGQVVIDGEDISRMSERELDRVRRKFGVTFQSGALLNSMSVGENIALPLEFHTELDRETIEIMVKMKLQQVHLREAVDRKPAQLSGGMLKRAALARALAMDPKILFYDEPSAGLDPIATARIDQLIGKLKTSLGITQVVVTHVMESVRRIADRVVMLQHGEILLDGSLDDLLRSDHPDVQRFVTGDVDGDGGGQIGVEEYLKDLLI